MAIDATVGGLQSNSYVSLAEAEAYFAARLRAEAWSASSEADKEKALLTACRRIEAHRLQVRRRPYLYPGEPADTLDRRYDWLAPLNADQALSFPRRRDQDHTGAYAVPQQVREAQCEEALALLSRGAESERRHALQAAGVTGFSVDGLSESYEAGASRQLLMSGEARMLLAPFVDRGGVIATSDNPDGEWSPGSA
ncbi:MAG: DnaT-like ssDNA-binding protein [Armatimonadota bacterium]